jgi:hypothetical protein
MNIMNLSTLKRFSRLPLVRAAGVVSILAGTSGCVVAVRPAPAPVVYEQPVGAPGEVVVTSDPPAPLYETIGVAPGPGFIWVGGYYHWNGGGGSGGAAAGPVPRTPAPRGSAPATSGAEAAGSTSRASGAEPGRALAGP